MDFAFVDVFTMENLIYNCRAIVFFDLRSIVIQYRSVEIHGVIKAAHSDPVGMQTNRVTRDYSSSKPFLTKLLFLYKMCLYYNM